MSDERRVHQRRKIYVSCQVDCGDRLASGKIIDASDSGIAILLPEAGDLIKGETRIHIPPAHQLSGEDSEAIVLRARLANIQQKTKGHRLGLRILLVESGEPEWRLLCREFQNRETQSGQAGFSMNQPGGAL